MEILKFPNKIKFWCYIHSLDKDLDFGATIKLPHFWYYYKGEKHTTSGITQTLTELNTLLHTQFDAKASIATGNRVTLFVNPKFDLTSDNVIVEDEIPLDVDFSNELDEPLIQAEFIDDPEDNFIDEEQFPTVDWDHVDELYDDSDKNSSKDRLEEYALQFNIELSKRKSFANMVKDFRKELSK